MMRYLLDLAKMYFEDFEGFSERMERFARAGVIEYRIIDREHRYVSLDGAVRTVLYDAVDPINVLVLLALVFYGPYWTRMPDRKEAFREMNRWWKEKVKKQRARCV